MTSRARFISTAFSKSGVLSTVTSDLPEFDNQKSSVSSINDLPDTTDLGIFLFFLDKVSKY